MSRKIICTRQRLCVARHIPLFIHECDERNDLFKFSEQFEPKYLYIRKHLYE
jgi:hypothetical protein